MHVIVSGTFAEVQIFAHRQLMGFQLLPRQLKEPGLRKMADILLCVRLARVENAPLPLKHHDLHLL
jgi:hypothetical protein